MKKIQTGKLVRLKLSTSRLREAVFPHEWKGTGIVLDGMEMSDGFWMFEVAFGTSIEWFQDLELELVTK